MNIKSFSKEDSEDVLRMIQELAYFHSDTPSITQESLVENALGTHPWLKIFVAPKQGYAALYPVIKLEQGRKGINLHHLYVEPHCRGAGVGNNLITHCINYAKELNCEFMNVSTTSTNDKAHSFYKSYGFKTLSQSGIRFKIEL